MKKLIFYIQCGLLIGSLTSPSYAKVPENLGCAKLAVVSYYKSGEYERDVDNVVKNAEKYLQKRVGENRNTMQQRKLAIVLDIDETSLSNFDDHNKRDFANFKKDVNESYIEAKATAIRPVLRLYNEAIRYGVDVFFISFRENNVISNTIDNLQRAGFYNWKGLYLPSKTEKQTGAVTYKKGIRKELIAQGYNIILNIGDQDSDLEGGYAETTYKLPNPMYTHECQRQEC